VVGRCLRLGKILFFFTKEKFFIILKISNLNSFYRQKDCFFYSARVGAYLALFGFTQADPGFWIRSKKGRKHLQVVFSTVISKSINETTLTISLQSSCLFHGA
jgi:hypothetical protein